MQVFCPTGGEGFIPFMAKQLCYARNTHLQQPVPGSHFFIPKFTVTPDHCTRKQWVELSASKHVCKKDIQGPAVTLQPTILNQHKWFFIPKWISNNNFGLFLSFRMPLACARSKCAHTHTCICVSKCSWGQVGFSSLLKRKRTDKRVWC